MILSNKSLQAYHVNKGFDNQNAPKKGGREHPPQ